MIIKDKHHLRKKEAARLKKLEDLHFDHVLLSKTLKDIEKGIQTTLKSMKGGVQK